MTDISLLEPATRWEALRTTSADWDDAGPELLGTMLVMLNLIRAFEEKVLELAGFGLVHGPAHSSIGQEGAAVGSILALAQGDEINGSHRGHHQFLAKALHHVMPRGASPGEPFPNELFALLQTTLAEILGLAQGFCKGRGGSMHLRWPEAGLLGTNAIVGGGAPLAAGAAWAHRRAGEGALAVTYFGDGAVNIGSVLESMNLSAAWKLPLCFFIENNGYAVSTTVSEATAEPRLSARGLGFALPAWKIDGMDPLAAYIAMRRAAEVMRSGGGATIIEADVYRYFHQNGGLPGSAFGYRSKSEEAHWRARDPIDRVAHEMIGRGHILPDEVGALRTRCVELMRDVASQLVKTGPDGKPEIRKELWPCAEFRDVGIRGDLSEFADVRTDELETFAGELVQARFVDVVADVMGRRMEQDERIVVLGEDVHRLKGGTNGATRGLAEKWPDRVLGTPIAENAFAGLAGGIAADGRYLPVVEFMYADFLWVAADQLFNQIGKARHMFGGDGEMPLVLRAKIAIGTGYGSQHSMDPAAIFASSVGWRIVAPSNPFDYVGLMNSALQCRDPVVVLEHVDLYNSKGPAPATDLDYFIPLGSAKVVRSGSVMTVLTYGAMVPVTLAAVKALDIDAEIVDLRSLDRAGLDWATIEASVARTNNVLIVEQGAVGTSYGALLSDEVQRRCFDWLDQPVQRVHGGEASPSVSKVLERSAFVGVPEVQEGLIRVMRDQGLGEDLQHRRVDASGAFALSAF